MKQRSSITGLIVIAVLLVLAVVIAAVLLARNNNSGNPSLAQSLSSPVNQNIPAFVSAISNNIQSINEINVVYSGLLLFSSNGGLLGNVQLSIPLRVTYQKLDGDSRMYVNASGVPLLGNITTTTIRLANGTSYSCSASSSKLSRLANKTGVMCYIKNSGNLSIASLNESALERDLGGSNSTVVALGRYEYRGQACELFRLAGNSTTTTTANSVKTEGQPLRFNITTCISNQYSVPLNITAVLSSQNSGIGATFSINETSIGMPVTDAEITALPGPVASK
jgi:hypothetical protein